MEKDKALDKIKKCLRLSKSANEHEAAQALKQAQSLMREYEISDLDIAMSEVSESSVKIPKKYTFWQSLLFKVCREAFGCQGYIDQSYDKKTDRNIHHYHFYGVSPKPELASYAYEVLIRQLRAARRQYMATQLKNVRNIKNKTYRADEFCYGWIYSVYDKINEFACSEEEKQKMAHYLSSLGEMGEAKPRQLKVKGNIKKQGIYDQCEGWEQGKHAQLNHAMNGGQQQTMLEN